MKIAVAFAVVAVVTLELSAGLAHAEGDAAAGESVFNRCKTCHTIDEGGSPKMGPNLYGVYGRQAGTAPPGSLHTTAMEESGVVWDDQTLTEWLAAPKSFIEGTKMTFRLTNEQDIADVIAYLKANSPDAVQSSMAQDVSYTPKFNDAGELLLPKNGLWREWIYVGTPVTPNALNGGEAPFPEVHSVYIDPESWQHWKATGAFREGTIIAKELSLVLSEDVDENGATTQVSGTGYFMSELQGLEITIKSAELYPDEPGNWVYYTFGHQPEPYQPAAAPQPAENCNACHDAFAADDFVFTQFYPVLRVSKPQ